MMNNEYLKMQKNFNYKITEKIDSNKRTDFEARQNLFGFFNLLLQIDRRNNPEKYKKSENNENNGNTNNTN